MVEDLSTFNFDNVDGKPGDVSPTWFNEFPYEPIGKSNTHYSDQIDPERTEDLRKAGWLNKDGSVKEIIYNTYEYGFRTPLTSEPSAVFLGCSNTFGTGLNFEQTFSYKVSKSLGLPCVNLGIPGASLDHSYRILKTFLPVLNPKYIFCLAPESTRGELTVDPIIHANHKQYADIQKTIIKSFNINTGTRKKLVDPLLNLIRLLQRYVNPTLEYQLSNYNRNLDAIKWVSRDYKFYHIPMYYYFSFIPLEMEKFGRARDLAHFGEGWHDIITKDFLKKLS